MNERMEELTRRLSVLKAAAQDYSQFVLTLDSKKENKEAEIKNLDLRIEKLKSQLDELQIRASGILQSATEETSKLRNDATLIMKEANLAKISSEEEMRKSKQMMQEAQALVNAANEKQKDADQQLARVEERRKKLEAALR